MTFLVEAPYDGHRLKHVVRDMVDRGILSIWLDLRGSGIDPRGLSSLYSAKWNAVRRGAIVTLVVTIDQYSLLEVAGLLHLIPVDASEWKQTEKAAA